ncbi:hypothetical protein FLONG3_10951 [Fusarium longipes]|uniref:Uncharacterized protein n=1 Tax=Fusarium longipes TaxID=694270 RepID=A0A395RJG6_9HYPO|nr:hypothetical protein FLONG3_10951 [Fusarium longipes]
MSSSNEKSAGGNSRRQSQAYMGNVANDAVDRSEETVVSRRQKRQQRRQTLRNQAEVAPFLGMDLGDEEEVKDKKKDGEGQDELNKNMIGSSPFGTIPELDEDVLGDKSASNGLGLDVYKTPPLGESEFPGQDEKWWNRNLVDSRCEPQ